MNFEAWSLVIGVLLLVMALAQPLIQRLPVTPAIFTLTIVMLSIIAHGISATPLFDRYAQAKKLRSWRVQLLEPHYQASR